METGLRPISTGSLATGTTHINHFPPELLAHVFGYLLDPVQELFPFPLPTSFHDWRVVTHVCWYWRTTALSTPALWPRIHISEVSDEAALFYLPLAGDLPLEVYYTADVSDTFQSNKPEDVVEDKALQAISANSGRLRELHIFSSLPEAHYPWEYFATPAVLLETLTIISSDEDDIGNPYVLPPIFGAEMPRLRKLVLANISLWPHDTFRNLKHLALYDQLDEARLPLHTFLNTLSQSPQLETLILISAGLEDDFIFDTSNLAKPLSLPCLRYLEMGDWSFEMVPVTFLKHVTLPPEATVCLWNLGWEADLRNLLFPHPGNIALLHQCTKINITCFLEVEHTCEADTLVGIKDSAIYYYANSVPPGFSALRTLGPFTNVTELNYCPDARWSKYGDIIDEDLLLMLPALKILRVSKAIWLDLEKLCNLLTQFEARPKNRQTQTESQPTPDNHFHSTRPRFRIAPLLEELHINHPFDHPDHLEHWSDYQIEDLNSLVLFANVRANNGVALKKLVLQGCTEETNEVLALYFETLVPVGRGQRKQPYWEDLVGEIWEKGKLPRPPQPDW